jgi:hypothetical protein
VLLLSPHRYLVYASNAFFMSGTERLIAEKIHRHGGEMMLLPASLGGHRIAGSSINLRISRETSMFLIRNLWKATI